MKKSTNFNLNLPEQNDFYDVENYNDNFKTIDEEIKKSNDALNDIKNQTGDMEGINESIANLENFTKRTDNPHKVNASQTGAIPLEAFTQSTNDLDVLLQSGQHCKMLRTNSNTLNTPYKKGLTVYGTALVISYAETATNGVQIAFMSGHDKQLTFFRTLREGTISDWTTAFLPLSGGTIKGATGFKGDWINLFLENADGTKRGIVELNPAGGVFIHAYTDTDNRNTLLLNPESDDVSNIIKVGRRVGGSQQYYNIYGEHNKPKAEDIQAGTFSGQMKANTDAAANAGAYQVRNIACDTNDLVAGQSPLATGQICFIFE